MIVKAAKLALIFTSCVAALLLGLQRTPTAVDPYTALVQSTQSSAGVWRAVSSYDGGLVVDIGRNSDEEYYVITTAPQLTVLNITRNGRSYLRLESTANVASLPESLRGSLNSWYALPEGRLYVQPPFSEFMKSYELDGEAVLTAERSWTVAGNTHGVTNVRSDVANRVSEITAGNVTIAISYEVSAVPEIAASSSVTVERAQDLLNEATQYQNSLALKP